jgi:hypothetical protein
MKPEVMQYYAVEVCMLPGFYEALSKNFLPDGKAFGEVR